jgi:hypothetical protein
MRIFSGAALAALLLLPSANAQTPARNVYVMTMPGALDQYLALHLTSSGVLNVVTDPQKADLILTDRIGGHFEENFEQKFGKPAEKDKDDASFARPGVSGGSNSRGAIFLVDRATRNVLWSTFELPKNTTPQEMNRTAEKIAERLGKSQKGKS